MNNRLAWLAEKYRQDGTDISIDALYLSSCLFIDSDAPEIYRA
ncbi:hypothetical protein [Xenorhabdus siamensis]